MHLVLNILYITFIYKFYLYFTITFILFLQSLSLENFGILNQAEQKVDANDDRATVRDEICHHYQKIV